MAFLKIYQRRILGLQVLMQLEIKPGFIKFWQHSSMNPKVRIELKTPFEIKPKGISFTYYLRSTFHCFSEIFNPYFDHYSYFRGQTICSQGTALFFKSPSFLNPPIFKRHVLFNE